LTVTQTGEGKREDDRAKRFVLTPVVFTDASEQPEFESERYLLKTHLHVRWAWEIGEGDLDSVAIHPDDDPIVPSDVEAPPVVRLLERIRKVGEKD
jgi:hypothetical protein